MTRFSFKNGTLIFIGLFLVVLPFIILNYVEINDLTYGLLQGFGLGFLIVCMLKIKKDSDSQRQKAK